MDIVICKCERDEKMVDLFYKYRDMRWNNSTDNTHSVWVMAGYREGSGVLCLADVKIGTMEDEYKNERKRFVEWYNTFPDNPYPPISE